MALPRRVEIRVVEQSGLDYGADALVLKYAQDLYGLDNAVAQRLGLRREELPRPNEHRIYRDPAGLEAHAVLFIGVKALHEFSYPEIRAFGYEAVCAVASDMPDAAEIAVTLHGAGYGLDEIACMEAEVAGIIDAIESDAPVPALRWVTFLEINPRRAERMRMNLEKLLGAEPTVGPRSRSSSAVAKKQERLREVAREAVGQEHAFVAMPFDDSFTDLFHYGLSTAVRSCGLLCADRSAGLHRRHPRAPEGPDQPRADRDSRSHRRQSQRLSRSRLRVGRRRADGPRLP